MRTRNKFVAIAVIVIGSVVVANTPASARVNSRAKMCVLDCPPQTGCNVCGGYCTDDAGGGQTNYCVYGCPHCYQ